MQPELHSAQATILRELLFHNGTNFASLNRTNLTNDHFTFHLKKLLDEGFIEKKGRLYFLTQKGKQFASKLDIDALQIEKQGGPSVAVTAKRVIDGTTHYLVHQRLKEPFYGYYGFVNGKVRFGEFTHTTAQRELFEETGLMGEPINLLIVHRLNGPSPQHIQLDHYFFLYLVKNPIGEIKDTKEGKNFWKPMSEIRQLKTFLGFSRYLDAVEQEQVGPYSEHFIELKEI